MKSNRIILKIVFIFLVLQSAAFSQFEYYSKIVSDTIRVNSGNQYELSGISIIPFSETVRLNDSLLTKNDYTISYDSASIRLNKEPNYQDSDTLIITYSVINFGFQKEYKKRSLVYRVDDEKGDSIQIVKETSGGFSTKDIFGPQIEQSGTLIRGFTVGTTKDFSLNSGLRLQLSGKLSEELEIVAALTDENTPIQPEGNTERLEELDKVFIQVKHPNVEGTFGDFQVQKRIGEFGFVERKLQGLLGSFNYGTSNGYVALAGSRGKFNTNFFYGIDGIQGPYRLYGVNNERDIIVLAGTEKVYVDGIEMKRGEGNDYVIEYSNAQITFTPNILITSTSRITVDFEYTARRYSRNFFGVGEESSFFDGKLNVKFLYIREGDNQDSPVDISLSENDKEILAAAGDDRNKAVKAGVKLAEADSTGRLNGAYTKIDSVVNGELYSYYVYNPDSDSSIYNVSFSFVGEGQGDYVRESLGNYSFAGINGGNYDPVVYLPLPELKQTGNFVLNFSPWEDINLSLEYAGSLLDENRFSGFDDGDNYGYARNILLNINPKEIEVAGVNLGKIGLTYKDRFIQDKFSPIDRINEIEYNRHYNIQESSTAEDEELRELSLKLIPFEELNVNSSFGFLRRGDNFKSNRYNNIIRLSKQDAYGFNYNFDFVDTKNNSLKSSWLRQTGDAYYRIWHLEPGIEFLAEDREDKFLNADSLLSSSLKYYEVNPFIRLVDLKDFEFSMKYSFREDYLPLNGIMQKESKSVAQFYELQYKGIKEVNSTINVTFRKKKYKQEFKQLGFLDNETILIRSQNRFRFWDALTGSAFYEVSTQKSARLEKVFIRVEQGTGNYKYLGDLNNNGVADENEFEPTLFEGDFIQITIPTDELFPIINLETSTRWKLDLSKIFDGDNFISKILSPVSTETYLRVEEKSREEDFSKIYLLQFSYFQNAQNTILGSNYFQQDFFLFENDRDLSIRFRYAQRKGLNQYSGGTERAFNRERSLRIRFQMVEEIANETELINQVDNVSAPVTSNRRREIESNTVTTDFSYRPERNIEVGFKIKAGRSTDYLPLNPTVIDINSQTIRFNLSFTGRGRLRAEIERNELIGNTNGNFLPFELTGGNLIGKNYYWRLNFDYRIASNLQSTLSYDGRVNNSNTAIHTGRAEVRAYF